MENTYSFSQNLCGRDGDQCLKWSRQNIPINGKKPQPQSGKRRERQAGIS